MESTRVNYGRETFDQVNVYGRLTQDMVTEVLGSEEYSLIKDISAGFGYNYQNLPDQLWEKSNGEKFFLEVKAHTTDSEWNGKSQVGVNQNQYNRYFDLGQPVYYAIYLRWMHAFYVFEHSWIKDNYSHSTRQNDVHNKIKSNRHNLMYYVKDLDSPQFDVQKYNLEDYRKIIGKKLWKELLTG